MKRWIITGALVVFSLNAYGLDLKHGRKLYEQHCMGCHGSGGEGMMPRMPNFSRGDRLFQTDRELADIVRDGNGVMPSFNGILLDEEIRDIIGYMRTFL